jgi:hypothetical protein
VSSGSCFLTPNSLSYTTSNASRNTACSTFKIYWRAHRFSTHSLARHCSPFPKSLL